jgi:hypothetical protein
VSLESEDPRRKRVMAKQVRCVNKIPRNDPHLRIRNIGGVINGRRWKLSQADAIRKIEAGTSSFYVRVGNSRVDVVVAKHERRKYLKTRPDRSRKNNLLSLPECP